MLLVMLLILYGKVSLYIIQNHIFCNYKKFYVCDGLIFRR